MLRLVGDAAMEKAGLVTVTGMVIVWLGEPLVSVPVTVTVSVVSDVADGTSIDIVAAALPV